MFLHNIINMVQVLTLIYRVKYVQRFVVWTTGRGQYERLLLLRQFLEKNNFTIKVELGKGLRICFLCMFIEFMYIWRYIEFFTKVTIPIDPNSVSICGFNRYLCISLMLCDSSKLMNSMECLICNLTAQVSRVFIKCFCHKMCLSLFFPWASSFVKHVYRYVYGNVILTFYDEKYTWNCKCSTKWFIGLSFQQVSVITELPVHTHAHPCVSSVLVSMF